MSLGGAAPSKSNKSRLLNLTLCISFAGRITSESDLNLVICKSTLVEIYLVNSEGLKFIKQFQIWGVVENLNIVKAKVGRRARFIRSPPSQVDASVASAATTDAVSLWCARFRATGRT